MTCIGILISVDPTQIVMAPPFFFSFFFQLPSANILPADHVNNEKKGPWLFSVYRGLCHYPVIFRDYFINHEVRIPINQPGFNGMSYRLGSLLKSSWCLHPPKQKTGIDSMESKGPPRVFCFRGSCVDLFPPGRSRCLSRFGARSAWSLTVGKLFFGWRSKVLQQFAVWSGVIFFWGASQPKLI